MSSPRLNNIIVVGCIMTYFSVILFGLDGGLIATERYGKVCIVSNFICIFIPRHRKQNQSEYTPESRCILDGTTSNLPITHFIVGSFSRALVFQQLH